MDKTLGKINRNLIIGWMIIVAVLIIAYFGEYFKGQRTMEYMAAFSAATVLPAAVCVVLYMHDKYSHKLRYFILGGYFVMYAFVLLTGSTTMVFTYILPMLSLIVLYHQPKLVLIMGVLSLIANLIYDVKLFMAGEVTLATSKDVEIQLALLFLCFGFLYSASSLYDHIDKDNKAYVKRLAENNRQLQRVTLQTITTIANIIDAKDEYTKGHSYRVAEYSSALAKELGYSEQQVQNTKYIGLLHDIGKIGIPDSILNKPGRLTDDEFAIMRKHVDIGDKILSGNHMIEGLEDGARYHHERYNGSGYPRGLKGDEIPEIARIIGIADAYDAMTSNRVYRKRLTDQDVIDELKRCSGTQFDPKICAVFVSMLEDGRLKKLSPDAVPETDSGSSLEEKSAALLRSVIEYRNSDIDTMHDFLTGAYSLQHGKNCIAESLLYGDGGLFLLDISNIRRSNEHFGTVAGDHLIKSAAEVLLAHDNMITVRYSGDEFLCFISGVTDRIEFEQTLNEICHRISEAFGGIHESTDNEVAIGGVLSAGTGRDLPALLNCADKALFYMKQMNHSGCYIYYKADHAHDDNGNISKRDLEQLIAGIEKDSYSGIYNIDYPEFKKVYCFIRNMCIRNGHQLQLLLMTITPIKAKSPTVADRDEAMCFLESAINTVLRKVDAMLRFSSTQYIIILNNTGRENITLIADRIMNTFYRQYDKKNMALSYDAADLQPPAGAGSNEQSKSAESTDIC